jgi:hypothetical protein
MIVTDLVALLIILLVLSAVWGHMLCNIESGFGFVCMVLLTGYIWFSARFLIGKIDIILTAYNLANPLP